MRDAIYRTQVGAQAQGAAFPFQADVLRTAAMTSDRCIFLHKLQHWPEHQLIVYVCQQLATVACCVCRLKS